jgi:nicotinate-nucleotide adenylyltransferase
MAVLATQTYDELYVDDIELQRGGTSYTVDTLATLHERYRGATFDWIIGEDNVAQLPRWREPERLFAMARFVVLARGARSAAAPNVVYSDTPLVPVSSTEIRQRVRDGQPIDAFVDPLVARYIHHYGLYKEGTA